MLTKGTSGNDKAITGTAVSAGSVSVTTFAGGTVGLSSDIGYTKGVRTMSLPAKNSKVFNIERFRPPFLFQSDEDGTENDTTDAFSEGSFGANRRIVKNQIRNILLRSKAASISHPNYAYTNYHTLNFFTSSNGDQIVAHGSTLNSSQVTTSSVLIYPCPTGSLNKVWSSDSEEQIRRKRFDGKYAPETSFTFDFYINPRYTNGANIGPKKGEFRAGTIYHMSGAYAVSLVTGSSKAPDGSADGYRLLLQLSQSAEYAPSKFKVIKDSDRPIFLGSAGNYKAEPFKYAWLSPDNSLKKNHWHHVAIRWSPKVNLGTGSFVIDGSEVSEFYIPSSSIRPIVNQNTEAETGTGRAIGDRFPAGRADPNALFIGNFYEGTNTTGSNATTIERFFNQTARKNEGFTLRPSLSTWKRFASSEDDSPSEIQLGDPYRFSFNHPLNAEVHDLKIFSTYRTNTQIYSSSIEGPADLSNLLFYVPPFFTYEKHDRRFLSNAISSSRRQDFVDTGGALNRADYPTDVFSQPYMSMPFNAGLSMTVDATLINLENFTKDIVNDVYPRLLFLTASSLSDKTTAEAALAEAAKTPRKVSEWLFQTASLRKRSLTVLPSDNGRFHPNYSLLYTGSDTSDLILSSSEAYPYRDDYGNFDPSLINLSDVFKRASPDRPYGNVEEGTADNTFLVYQATRDPSSNEIVIFNIPNLFYGNRIEPGTFTLTDENLSGSAGKVSITLKDDGQGSLYRADCLVGRV